MTNSSQQIVDCYEKLGMTPEQIAQDQELELTTIKATLFQFSSKYREDAKEVASAPSLDFADEEALAVKQVILNAALYSEDANLQFRAAKFVLNDKKGRLDIKKGIRTLNVNAITLNQHLHLANEAVERARSKRTVEIPEREAKMLQEVNSVS